jgi:hypothetical protein
MKAARRNRAALYEAPERAVAVPAAAVACAVALAVGWLARDALDLAPAYGVGWALGPIGLGAMVALLGYSLRKRSPRLARAGPLRRWFQTHMLLGVAGPTAITFHSGFELQSTNARIAFASMVLVAASGFLGRFVYTRVHLGLFGQRQSLRDVAEHADASRHRLAWVLGGRPAASAALRAFEKAALDERAPGPLRVLRIAWRARHAERAIHRGLRAAGLAGAALEDADAAVRAHLAAVRRLAEFSFYESALSLWHAVHLPLCGLLFTAAAIHVIAVYLY